MHSSRFELRLAEEPWAFFVICLVVLLIPIWWVLAWLVSMVLHELGHLMMAKLLSVPVYGMTVGITGARIHTAPMDPGKEFLCAAGGPVMGIILLFLGRWMPLVALCAFFHTVWNLLPVGRRDGARMLRCLWLMVRKIPCKPEEERVQ